MSISQRYINLLLIALIISGTLNVLAFKFQNSVVIDGVKFDHPYMQSFTVFFGEFLFFIIYAFSKNTRVSVSDESKPLTDQPAAPPKKPQKDAFFIVAIPALLDLMTGPLKYTALNFVNSSIYQIMRSGGLIIVTALFSKIFLKKIYKKFQLIGIGIVVIGVIIVGLSNFIYQDSSDKGSFLVEFIGIVLILASSFAQAGILITQEKILQTYEINLYYFIAVQGFWGLTAYAFILPVLNFLPCNLSVGCVEHNGKGYWERTDEFFYQAGQDPWLVVFIILALFSVSFFCIISINVIKYTSAVTRSVVDVIRTVFIWMIGLLVTFFSSKTWENTSWQSNLIQLVGYGLLVFGNLIYNKIIEIQFIAKLDNENKEDQESQTTIEIK